MTKQEEIHMSNSIIAGRPGTREMRREFTSYREYILPMALEAADDSLYEFLQYCIEYISFQRYETKTRRISYGIVSRSQSRNAEIDLVIEHYDQVRVEIDTFPVGSIVPKLQEEQDRWQEFVFQLLQKWIEKSRIKPVTTVTINTCSEKPKSLLECIEDYKKYISSDIRMSFWRTDRGVRKWIPHPEQHAKLQLFAFLRGTYGSSTLILEEVNAGAGRVDLFVMFLSQEIAIIELKMCGHGYSLNYAQKGTSQVQHYMANKEAKEGYLVILDSRLRDYGKLTIAELDENIKAVTIDVRPDTVS